MAHDSDCGERYNRVIRRDTTTELNRIFVMPRWCELGLDSFAYLMLIWSCPTMHYQIHNHIVDLYKQE
jgi:hypothetical protein